MNVCESYSLHQSKPTDDVYNDREPLVDTSVEYVIYQYMLLIIIFSLYRFVLVMHLNLIIIIIVLLVKLVTLV